MMGNPTAYDLLVAENERLVKELEASRAEPNAYVDIAESWRSATKRWKGHAEGWHAMYERMSARRDELESKNAELKSGLATAKEDIAVSRVALMQTERELIDLKQKTNNGMAVEALVNEVQHLKSELAIAKNDSGCWQSAYHDTMKGNVQKIAEMRGEIDELKAKLATVQANKRNATKYSEAGVDKLRNAYASLREDVYQVWFRSPHPDKILRGGDSGEGDSE